jgi:DNA-directed RNA polymerase sigma subunit (sigma70/sigma32)
MWPPITSLREQIQEVLARLNERERRVLQLRFGLEDGHRLHVGRSRMRI